MLGLELKSVREMIPNPLSLVLTRFAGLLIIASLAATPAQARKRAFPDLTRDGQPNIQAHAAIVFDWTNGKALYAKNADETVPIASISKLLVALVVRDRGLALQETQSITKVDHRVARGGARSRLRIGWKLTHKDLLIAALLGSDGRAISALGRAVGLDARALTAQMNAKARALGLEHTHFKEPTGLSAGNVSTARELVTVLRAAVDDPVLSEVMALPRALVKTVVEPGHTPREVGFGNTNRLARSGRWDVLGGKTGYTSRAGYCLTVAARLGDDREIGMVFLGTHGRLTRFGDFGRAMRWLTHTADGQKPPPS